MTDEIPFEPWDPQPTRTVQIESEEDLTDEVVIGESPQGQNWSPTEAPASATFRVYQPRDGVVFNIQYTLRASSARELVLMVNDVLKGMVQWGWEPAYGYEAPKKQPPQPAQQQPMQQQPVQQQPVQQPAQQPAQQQPMQQYSLPLRGKFGAPHDPQPGQDSGTVLCDCPLHPGEPLRRRSNDNGWWYSHKHGDGWCTGA